LHEAPLICANVLVALKAFLKHARYIDVLVRGFLPQNFDDLVDRLAHLKGRVHKSEFALLQLSEIKKVLDEKVDDLCARNVDFYSIGKLAADSLQSLSKVIGTEIFR
jgi:hypothetical protein